MIDIKELKISFNNKSLVDIAFTIKSSTALIGESGSGKSLTLKAILNLLSSSLEVKKNISSDFELSFDTIGFIPQNPFTSLSSMTKIKNQIFCSEKKKEEAQIYANVALFTAIAVGILLAIIGLFFSTPIALMLGATESTKAYASTYLRYILIGSPFSSGTVERLMFLTIHSGSYEAVCFLKYIKPLHVPLTLHFLPLKIYRN